MVLADPYHDHNISDILLLDVPSYGIEIACVESGGMRRLVDRRGILIAHVEWIPAPLTRIGITVPASATYYGEELAE